MKVAEEITKAFDRTYRPTQFVAEILCTIHILGREPLAGMFVGKGRENGRTGRRKIIQKHSLFTL